MSSVRWQVLSGPFLFLVSSLLAMAVIAGTPVYIVVQSGPGSTARSTGFAINSDLNDFFFLGVPVLGFALKL